MDIKEAARQELKRRGIEAPVSNFSQTRNIKKEARLELARRGLNISENKPENIARTETPIPGSMLAKRFAKGVLSQADLPQMIGRAGSARYRNEVPYEWVEENALPETPYISEMTEDALRQQGLDLGSNGPQGSLENIGARGAEFAGAMAGPGFLGHAAKAAGKHFVKPGLEKIGKALIGGGVSKSAGLGAAIGGTSGAAQELGANPIAADLAASFSVPGLRRLPKQMARINPRIAGEKAAIEKLYDIAGHENIPGIVESIEKRAPSPIGEMPMTAEVANNVGLSQIQTGLLGSPKHPDLAEGISQREIFNQETRQRALDELSPHKYTPEEAGNAIASGLESELKKRISHKRSITRPPYHQLEEIKDRVDLKKPINYIENELIDLQPGDEFIPILNKAKKRLQGKEISLTDEVKKGAKIENGFIEVHGEKYPVTDMYKSDIKYLPPTVYQIEKALKRINNDRRKLKFLGDYDGARLLKNVIKETYDELEPIHPEVKKVREHYRESMKPVNEITENPHLKKILKKRPNGGYDISISEIPGAAINKIMSSQSEAKTLKNILGDNKDAWDKIQSGSGDLLTEHAHTPFQYNKFFKKRKEAIKEIFDENQYKVLEHISDRSKEKLRVSSQAKTEGSPTAARIAMYKELEKGPFGGTLLSKLMTPLMGGIGFSQFGVPGAIAGGTASTFWNHWKDLRKNSFQKTIETVIMNPDEAKFLLQKYDTEGIKKANEIAKKIKSDQKKGIVSSTALHGKKEERDDKLHR